MRTSSQLPDHVRARMPVVCPPERQGMTKPFVAIGMICRALILFWAVFGLALFFCDAFRLTTAYPGGAVSTQTLALMGCGGHCPVHRTGALAGDKACGASGSGHWASSRSELSAQRVLADRFRHDMERLYGAARGRRLWCCPMDT